MKHIIIIYLLRSTHSLTCFFLNQIIIVLAHQYFTGLIEFGVIAQSRQAFWHVLNDLSIIINEFNGIASFMAGIDRLFLFMKAVQELDCDRPNEDENVITKEECILPEASDVIIVREVDTFGPSSSPKSILTLRNVRLTTPDNKRTLFRNLNLQLTEGQNLLISGVSGAGKSSLLRAIAGLWNNGDGEIIRTSDVYFLPQRPYCPPGTLRDQLLYPSTELGYEYISDELLLNILNTVDLPNLASIAGEYFRFMHNVCVYKMSRNLSHHYICCTILLCLVNTFFTSIS